jgi:hypothetical protein
MSEGPVMLASAALNQALPGQEVPDLESGNYALPPPLLIVTVDLRKVSDGKQYHHFAVLVDTGVTYNFFSHAVADRL